MGRRDWYGTVLVAAAAVVAGALHAHVIVAWIAGTVAAVAAMMVVADVRHEKHRWPFHASAAGVIVAPDPGSPAHADPPPVRRVAHREERADGSATTHITESHDEHEQPLRSALAPTGDLTAKVIRGGTSDAAEPESELESTDTDSEPADDDLEDNELADWSTTCTRDGDNMVLRVERPEGDSGRLISCTVSTSGGLFDDKRWVHVLSRHGFTIVPDLGFDISDWEVDFPRLFRGAPLPLPPGTYRFFWVAQYAGMFESDKRIVARGEFHWH